MFNLDRNSLKDIIDNNIGNRVFDKNYYNINN